MSLLKFYQDLRPEREEPEVAVRLRRTDARLSWLLDVCASVLGESALATKEFSDRMPFLREEIEWRAVRRPQDEESRS